MRIPTGPAGGGQWLLGGVRRATAYRVGLHARIRHLLTLTWTVPVDALTGLLPDGLDPVVLRADDGERGLLTAEVAALTRIRPAGPVRALAGPAALVGLGATLLSYRLRARFEAVDHELVGGVVLATTATNPAIVTAVNLTGRPARVATGRFDLLGSMLAVDLRAAGGAADLAASADLGASALPAGSSFADAEEALAFAGPDETELVAGPRGVTAIRRRITGTARPVAAEVQTASILDGRWPGLEMLASIGDQARLSAAFHVAEAELIRSAGRLHRPPGAGGPWQSTVVR